MINQRLNKHDNNKNSQKTLVFMVFLAGTLNSKQYLEFMGYSGLYKTLEFGYYSLLALLSMLTIIEFLYIRKGEGLPVNIYSYWILLFFAVVIKYLFLFLQFPDLFLPGKSHFSPSVIFISNFLLIFILIMRITSVKDVKELIFALGLGASFSTIIPLLFYPEMIANRITIINEYNFYGSFWNASVISFITVGWLLIAASNLNFSKWRKTLLLTIFIIFVFGSLAGLSRAALLAIITSMTAYLFLSKSISKYLKITISLGLLAYLVSVFFPEVITSLSLRLEGGINIDNEARSLIWKDYIVNISDYLLFGEIEGNYRKYSPGGYGPHSVLLNWLTQFGILGLLGFLILIYGVLISIRKVQKNQSKQVAAGLYSWLIAYLSVALINETGFDQLTFFVAIGIILGWGKTMKIDNKSIPHSVTSRPTKKIVL